MLSKSCSLPAALTNKYVWLLQLTVCYSNKGCCQAHALGGSLKVRCFLPLGFSLQYLMPCVNHRVAFSLFNWSFSFKQYFGLCVCHMLGSSMRRSCVCLLFALPMLVPAITLMCSILSSYQTTPLYHLLLGPLLVGLWPHQSYGGQLGNVLFSVIMASWRTIQIHWHFDYVSSFKMLFTPTTGVEKLSIGCSIVAPCIVVLASCWARGEAFRR